MLLRTRLVCAAHELGLPLLLLWCLSAAALGSSWEARLALGALALQACRLALADADLSLLALGAPPRGAFTGKAVWLVGASQGLGEAVATHLAQHGATLILSARRADALQRVAKLCMAQGASAAHVVPLDLREEASVIAAARQAAALAPSGLSYLFLLAGGTQRSAAEETSGEVEADMFALNCLSLMALTKAALPALQAATRSRIVVLSSAAGKLASPGQAGYAGSKHALNGFFGSLRAELASTSVRVTLVCPGPVATGAPGQPRVTFGATLGASTLGGSDAVSAAGAAGTKETARLPVSRAAALTVAAAAHGVREAWLAKHPVLLLLFLTQYAPLLGAAIVDKVGPKRVRAARQGGDMYALAK